jgi:dipeptidyl aminopeptidase/acylaminoacyl peptidase
MTEAMPIRSRPHRAPVLLVALVLGLTVPRPAEAQAPFTLEDVLSPPFPYELVAARAADRIAWLSYEKGVRNVYTAAGPEYRPERLTDWTRDDGRDLTGLQVSDDGATLVFIRGHEPNRQGWVANPASDPAGARREAWAVSTAGGEPWRVAEAEEPALSPDGRWIAYARDGAIHRAPVSPAALAGLDPDTLAPLVSVFGDSDDPVWSPDSRRIAFESDRDDHAFIGVYDTETGRVVYLAPGVDRDSGPAWSPDGSRVAFIRRPGVPFDPPEREPWWRRSLEPDTARPDGLERSGFAGGHRLEIWVADAETGEGRRLWHSDAGSEAFTDVRRLHWAGDHLLFESEPGEWEGHIYALRVHGTGGPGMAGRAAGASSPDGGRPSPRELTTGGGIVEHVTLSPDGEWLYYDSNVGDIDRRHLWRVRVAGGEPERLTDARIETYPAVLPTGTVALLQAGAWLPQSVAVMAVDGEPRLITRLPPEFPRRAHVEPETVILTAPDGLEVHAQLFLPPDLEPGEKRPALLFIHGGPRRQMLLGYHYMHFYHMAYAVNQYFANRGYVTMSVNYRSGIGYGTAFRDIPDYGRRGNSEYQDILAAGLYLRSRPDVDREQVGLWGLSYGGILTAQGLARNSDIFRAGVDMAGVHLYGGADEPESTIYQSSAVAAIDSWTSPVLLIHGDDDRNVDFSQTVGLVQLLRAHGVPYELIVFPDEVHDFLVFERWLEAFRATDDFFERVLIRGERIGVGAAGTG